MNFKKFNIGHFIVLLLIVLNGYLIITNHKKNIVINSLNEREIGLKAELPKGTTDSIKADFSSLNLPNTVNLLLIYPKDYCGGCIDMDLPILKEIAKRYPSIIYVLDNGTEYNLVSLIDPLSKSANLIAENISILPESLVEVSLPKMYLVDSNGLILSKYESRYGDFLSQKIFFEEVFSLLTIAYE